MSSRRQINACGGLPGFPGDAPNLFGYLCHHSSSHSIDASHACRLNIACCNYQSSLRALQGFQKLRNVTGGIDAYAREVDSSVPLY